MPKRNFVFDSVNDYIKYLSRNQTYQNPKRFAITIYMSYVYYIKIYTNQIGYPKTLFPGGFIINNNIPIPNDTKAQTLINQCNDIPLKHNQTLTSPNPEYQRQYIEIELFTIKMQKQLRYINQKGLNLALKLEPVFNNTTTQINYDMIKTHYVQ